MLKILDDESTIRRCQRLFIRALRPFVTDRVAVKIGHPGESVRARVFWVEGPGIWFHSKAIAEGRYWNAFGIGKPAAGSAVSSTIEINIPTISLDRKIGGAFAQDEAGKLFLVHRGKIGGRRGVGKSLFEAQYRGVWAEVEDGDTRSTVVVIGEMRSPLFVRQLAQFVRKIEAVKDLGADDDQQARIFFDDDRFREEFIGGRYVPAGRDYTSECNRDLAVLDLAHRLRELGMRVKSNPDGDLFTSDPAGRIEAVFAVLIGVGSPFLEQGVARLLLRSLNLPREPRRLLVMPAKPEEGWDALLLKLGIHVIPYSWENGVATFAGLADRLAKMDVGKTES
ncbi:MAG TPA: hypothetical protein VF336_05165 [Syntrophales bacterium]